MTYHLEWRSGTVWVAVGIYGSVEAAYQQLQKRGSSRRGLWRIISRTINGHEEVVTVVST